MSSQDAPKTNGRRVAAACCVVAVVVFAAGYLLGKQLHQPVELPPTPPPEPVVKRIPRFVHEGSLGYPLGTVIEISGQIYFDGAGFPLDRDRIQVSAVNGKPLYRDISITGGNLPENGTVHFRGYEAIEKRDSYTLVDGKPVRDTERPWHFERRFVVTETVENAQADLEPNQ